MSAAVGLDLFAAAWVERWLANGGSISIDEKGKSFLFIPANVSDVAGYDPPPPHEVGVPGPSRADIDEWLWVGRTRELIELLECIPGGRDAVKSHVREFPSRAYRNGAVELA